MIQEQEVHLDADAKAAEIQAKIATSADINDVAENMVTILTMATST